MCVASNIGGNETYVINLDVLGERDEDFDSLILYLESDGFRPWPNLPTGPR